MTRPELLSLPAQPAGVPWPTTAWPAGSTPSTLEAVVDEVFSDESRFGTTYAVVVVQGGRLLVERYGGALPSFGALRGEPGKSWLVSIPR